MNILKNIFKKKSTTQIFEISLVNISTAFERMKNEADWDTSKKMYWGYYFQDHNLQKLEAFGKKLQNFGYQIVEVRSSGNNDLYLLHIEEHVSYTPKSLFEQCHQLAKLAIEDRIEVFDGWDVEKNKLNKGLVQ